MEMFALKLEEEKILLNCSNIISNAFRSNVREKISNKKRKETKNICEEDLEES